MTLAAAPTAADRAAALLEPDELAALEAAMQHALATGDQSGLEVLGFGELSTVVRYRAGERDVAAKRLLPYPSATEAEAAAQVILDYVAALRARGVEVVETAVATTPCPDGTTALYCLQRALPASSLGPEHFRRQTVAEALQSFRQIFERIQASVSPTLTPDGQLSNWAFPSGTPVYLDVGAPFMRDERGRPYFDFGHLLGALPRVVAWPVRRFLLTDLISKYFSLRTQVIDFLGNLHKERLEPLVEPLLEVANRELPLGRPVSLAEVRAYYAEDARVYAVMQAAARTRLWWMHDVAGKPYPYLPKPKIDRNIAR